MRRVATPFRASIPSRRRTSISAAPLKIQSKKCRSAVRRHPHHELDVRPPLVGLVDRFVVPPDRIAAVSLERADGVRRRERLPSVGREIRRQKGRGIRAVDPRLQRGGQDAGAVLSGVEVGT